ncbi:MAG TPA: hypothetical protein VN397_04150 [Candidatus Methylomirabilis sp.]|nr:hypothetical protein [Candidatus Methylomirabilis sp.]
MPRRLNAMPDRMEGNAARNIEGGAATPEAHAPAPAPEARTARAREAKRQLNVQAAEEQAQVDEVLASIQEQMKTVAGVAEHVTDLTAFRKQAEEIPKRKTSAQKDNAAAQEFLAKDIAGVQFRAAVKRKRKPQGMQDIEMAEKVEEADIAGASFHGVAERKRQTEEVKMRLVDSERNIAANALERLERDSTLQEHLALAEAARVRAHFVRRAVEKSELTDENSWEYVHQLRSKELELEAALQDAWKRPDDELDLAPSKEERKSIVDSLLDVQNTLATLRQAVETRAEAKSAQVAFERSYAEARSSAMEKYRADMERARDVREMNTNGKLPDEQRTRYLDLFQQRAEQMEHELERLDELSPAEAAEFENAAAYEATSETLKDLRVTMHGLLAAEREKQRVLETHFPAKSTKELERELDMAETGGEQRREASQRTESRGERLSAIYGSIDRVLANLSETEREGRMTEEWRDQAIIELSRAYGDLEEQLRYFQTQAPEMRTTQETRARIGEVLHRIDDARARLHTKRFTGAPAAPESIRHTSLGKELKAKQREVKDLERQADKLAKAVRNMYGRDPDEIVARGGLGLGGTLKRGVARLTGQDVYGEWKAVADRLDDLSRELYPALMNRPSTVAESLAKLRAQPELQDVEALRIEQRGAARTYRETPATEEEFFNGSFEEPGEVEPSGEHLRVAGVIESAKQRGVNDAGAVYRNIAENPAAELLSFGPEEYVQQLAIVHEARAAQGSKKGRDRFAAKKRLKAALGVLTEMQNELRENGIDVDTGQDVRARVGGTSRGMMMVEKRRARAAKQEARRRMPGGGMSINT